MPAMPVASWGPRYRLRNALAAQLCQPQAVRWVWVDGGRGAGNIAIYNRTNYGTNILEGVTGSDEPTTPEDEGGWLTVTGFHIGDELYSDHGGSFRLTSCDPARATSRSAATSNYGLNRFPALLILAGLREFDISRIAPQSQAPRQPPIRLMPDPFQVFVAVEPAASGLAVVRVRADGPLAGPPRAEFFLDGAGESQALSLRLDAISGTYSGQMTGLPTSSSGHLSVTAIGRDGRSVQRTKSFALAPLHSKEESNVFSGDGILSLTFPAGVFPEATRIGIGPGDVADPVLLDGRLIAAGPFKLTTSTRAESKSAYVLRFQLPGQLTGQPRAGYRGIDLFELSSLELLHYDERSHRWEHRDAIVIPEVGIISSHVKEMGIYVLVARRH